MQIVDADTTNGLRSRHVCPAFADARPAEERHMPNRLIAHLAHVEVLTPKPEESLGFYRDVIGLEESGRAGRSVYLRGWGEWSHHSVQLTEAPHPGLGHVGWRTWSPEDLSTAGGNGEAARAGGGGVGGAVGPRRAHRHPGPRGPGP